MNSSLVTGYGAPDSLMGIVTGFVTARMIGIRKIFELLSMAATACDAASMTSASDRPDVAANPKAAGTNSYGRFQREIVPHLDAAYNFARFLSRNPDAAQDIVQEAFLRAYRGFDRYRGGDARAWIFSIVRNCYHNWLLEGRRKGQLEVDVHHRDDGSDFSVEDV